MPLTPATVTPIIFASMPANGLVGISNVQLAAGLSNGLCQYNTSGINVISSDVGVTGTGTGVGFGIILSPATLQQTLTASFIANLILGPFSPSLVNAIAMGFSQSFALANIQTISPQVGIGAGVVTLLPTPAISTGVFLTAFQSVGITGPNVLQLASAVSSGLDTALLTATGIVAIAGSPSIVPSVGVGIGKLF